MGSVSTVASIAPDPSEATQTFAQQSILASSKAEVARRNGDAIFLYHGKYSDYVANMQSGEDVPADRRIPPTPPMAWELAPADANGYIWPQVGTTPVCPAGPAVPCNFDNQPTGHNAPAGAPVVFSIGVSATPGWYSAPGDNEPAGFQKTLPGPNGSMMTVVKVVTPWGGLYEVVG